MDHQLAQLQYAFTQDLVDINELNMAIDNAIDRFKELIDKSEMTYTRYIEIVNILNNYIIIRNERIKSVFLQNQYKNLHGIILYMKPSYTMKAKHCVFVECTTCKKRYTRCNDKKQKDIFAPFSCDDCNGIHFEHYTPASMEDIQETINDNTHKKGHVGCFACFSKPSSIANS
jgi:hypothetical protein